MERLSNMIDKYEKLLHANWDLATDEQKLRIKKIENDIKNNIKDNDGDNSQLNSTQKLDSILNQLGKKK